MLVSILLAARPFVDLAEALEQAVSIASDRNAHYDRVCVDVGRTLALLAGQAIRIADETRVRGEQPNPREIVRQVLDAHPEVSRDFFTVVLRLVREHLDELDTPVS